MDDDRLRRQMAFAVEIGKVKHVLRRTFTIHGDRNENDAEHSWHLAVMAVILQEYAGPGVDILQVLKMVVVHDLVEIDGRVIGDGKPGPITKKLISLFREFAKTNGIEIK